MEEWERKLAEVSKKAWDDFHKAGFRRGTHEAEQFEKGVLKTIENWVKANPPPAQAVVKGGQGAREVKNSTQAIEELNLANRSAKAAKLAEGERMLNNIRRTNNFRRGIEGTTNLATIVGVAGTMGLGTLAVVVAKAAVKMLIEDMVISGALKLTDYASIAWQQATMPRTMREAEAMYQCYAQSCRSVVRFPDEKVGTVLMLPVDTRENWLASNYGVRWDALSR